MVTCVTMIACNATNTLSGCLKHILRTKPWKPPWPLVSKRKPFTAARIASLISRLKKFFDPGGRPRFSGCFFLLNRPAPLRACCGCVPRVRGLGRREFPHVSASAIGARCPQRSEGRRSSQQPTARVSGEPGRP